MHVTFQKLDLPAKGIVVFPVGVDLKFTEKLNGLDAEWGGVVRKAVKSHDFKGKFGKCLSITGGVGEFDRVVLLGRGESADASTEYKLETLGSKLFDFLEGERIKKANLVLEDEIGGFSQDFAAARMAYGATLKSYRFDHYFTRQKDEDKPALEKLSFLLQGFKEADKKFEALGAISEGVFLSRNVVSEPPNVIYPESYAEKIQELKSLGIKVEVLGEKQLAKLGMGALLGVGQGSERESQVVVLQWSNASDKNEKPVAFVGKGVTFDTGGISIKPAQNMEDMKYDMAGSAAVVGLFRALAGRKARVNAVGVVGLVENMPDGNAQRPSDIVKTMSGQTVEVINTDAEGRLVLADCLWYTQDRFKPKFMVNLATLTGAIVVALADQYCGLFSNNDELSERLAKAGGQVGENVWRFPLSKEYDKMIDSKVADMKNVGDGRGAGSITAAQFLQRFVNETPWAHLDIAGMAWTKKGKDLTPEGATGFGVRLLDRLVAEYYEA